MIEGEVITDRGVEITVADLRRGLALGGNFSHRIGEAVDWLGRAAVTGRVLAQKPNGAVFAQIGRASQPVDGPYATGPDPIKASLEAGVVEARPGVGFYAYVGMIRGEGVKVNE